MSLQTSSCFQYLVMIIISQAYAIDYTLYRNDPVPSLESVASKVPPLENLLQALLVAPSSSPQQETEKLLEYAGLVRLKLLSKLGFEVYNNEELRLPEMTALNDIYQRTLERKNNLLSILPLENTTLQQFCSLVDESPSGKTCEKISQDIPLTFPPAPASVKLTLSSILSDLKNHKLELTSQLFLGLLLHVPFNNYDARTHNSLRHLIFFLLQNSDLKLETGIEHKNYNRIVDMVRDILTSGVFSKATPHAQYLSEQLEELIPLNSNIEALSAILEKDKINLKFLFDTVLANDTLDQDLIDAKNYLRHKLSAMKDWDMNELVGAEKYEYLKQDQLLIGLLDKLIDLDFVTDIASALKVDAYFWHKSHMIENLNGLLDLFDNYNNLRGVKSYRELMKTIGRIKNNLVNSNNVTIELLCTRPRACLRQGLIKVGQCRGINQETKALINNFLEQSKDCPECAITKCDPDDVVPIELDIDATTEEPDCNSEECEDDEVKASMVEDDENVKKVKKMRVDELEEYDGTTTEGLEIAEGLSDEETTEHVIEVIEVLTERSTTEATTEPSTTEVVTEPPTTEAATTETTTEPPTTEVPTTEKITKPTTESTTKKITEPTTEKTTEQPTTEEITESTTEEITERPTEKVTEPTTEKIQLVEVPLKEVTLKPSIPKILLKEPEIMTTLGITESTARASVKMMPSPSAKVEIETPAPTESIPSTVAPPKRKRVICHHRDLHHRKKLNKLNKLKMHKHEGSSHSGSGSGNIKIHSHSSSGEMNLHLQSASDKTKELTTLRPIGGGSGDKVVLHGGKDSNLGDEVDLHVHSHSGELGLHSDSESGKVKLLSHSDSGKLQLHSKSNSSELGVKSDSGSSKVNLQSTSELGENVSASEDDEHSSLLERTYNLASKGAKKVKAGIGKLNPFAQQNEDSSENTNVNINARRSGLGSKIYDSSEEMGRNLDSSGSDQESAEMEHKYFENRKNKKKSKEFSRVKNSESSHNSRKKMTSYYNEEVKEEKFKKRRSNVRRSQSSKSRRADQNHKGHHHSRRKNADKVKEENPTDGVKSRMLDLDMTKFFNLEFKRDENIRKKVPTAKRSVDVGQFRRFQGNRLGRVLREAPETEIKPRIFNIGASKFANIEFKRDENYTEFKK